MKLLLFDLDGTLLDNDKNISERTLAALKGCRAKGVLIGVSTSRSEQNSLAFLTELKPDILISSGGALVKKGNQYLYKAEMSAEETKKMIATARRICGADCEITIDTISNHYWNYKIDPKKQDKSWGDSIYTDFSDFQKPSLKMCVEIAAFGDDFADIGMLKLCGLGIAMGNAIDEVKEIADMVIGRNDKDGIAEFLEKSRLFTN